MQTAVALDATCSEQDLNQYQTIELRSGDRVVQKPALDLGISTNLDRPKNYDAVEFLVLCLMDSESHTRVPARIGVSTVRTVSRTSCSRIVAVVKA